MILVLTLNKVRNRNMITKPVFLCGYTSSGKTTVGKELAKQLGVPFFDTDTLLEEQTGQTPQQLFAEKGEACFRDLEHEIARQASCYPPCVISTGGGMLASERNGKLLSEAGTIIYLNRPFEDCYRSLMQTPERPLIKNNTKEELRERYEKRAVSYQTYADFTVKNDRTPQQTAKRILALLGTHA
ncbi:shikimate kinase [Clostridium sp. AM42-4]|jgi:shikimate kinase|nr:shikimate kinase [Clostridium sp. AM42-4]